MRGRIVNDVRLAKQLPVDVDFLVHDLYAVARQTNHALHEVLMFLIRKFENYDVAPVETTVGQDLLVPSARATKDKLVDQQVVANKQSAFHGRRGNLEGLDNKGCAKQREDHRYQKRLQIFGESSVVLLSRRFRHLRSRWRLHQPFGR